MAMNNVKTTNTTTITHSHLSMTTIINSKCHNLCTIILTLRNIWFKHLTTNNTYTMTPNTPTTGTLIMDNNITITMISKITVMNNMIMNKMMVTMMSNGKSKMEVKRRITRHNYNISFNNRLCRFRMSCIRTVVKFSHLVIQLGEVIWK